MSQMVSTPSVADIVEFGGDAAQVADAIAVGVGKGADKDLIKNSGFEPIIHLVQYTSGTNVWSVIGGRT